jgi:two-component system OmpR family response regulator
VENHLVIIEDEVDLRSVIERYLSAAGFRVSALPDGSALRRLIEEDPADLYIVDIGLPNEDGLSLTRMLREETKAGVVIITGRNDAVDRVVGLEMGADDYIGKPFLPRELLARIRSVLRRLQPAANDTEPQQLASPSRYRVHGFMVDLAAHQVTDTNGETVALTSSEFSLLTVLIEHRTKPVSREALLEAVFHRGWTPYDRSIDVHMANLRRKLEPNPHQPKVIKTVRSIGYVLTAPVEVIKTAS